MADKNDVIMITLDRPRMIWFGHRALKTLSAITGKSLGEIDLEDFEMEDIEKIMYCAFLSDAKTHGETLKLEDMEDLLDKAPFHEILAKLQEGFSAAFGTEFDKQKNEQRIATAMKQKEQKKQKK